MCAVSGVLVLSLPIPIIAGNFEKFHKTQAKKNKLLKRRAATAAAKVREEKVKDSVRWHYYHLLCIDFMEKNWKLKLFRFSFVNISVQGL